MRTKLACAWAWMVLAFVMTVTFGPATSQVLRFVVPDTTSFLEVAHGTSVAAPVPPPAPNPSLLSTDLITHADPDSPGVYVRIDGEIRVPVVPGVDQLLIFYPDTGGEPIRILARLPFDLSVLVFDPADIELEHRGTRISEGPQRTLSLTLSAASQDRFQLVQRTATDTISVLMDAHPIGIDIRGLVVRQRPASQSTADPSHDYTHPLPVDIQTRDGTVTTLWQGQRVVLDSDAGSRSVNIFVLVSEVAKPVGDARYLLEGGPYSLELLIVTETP